MRVFLPQSNMLCLDVSEVTQVQTRRELTLQHIGCAEGTRSSHPWEGEGGHGCIYAYMNTPQWLCINRCVHTELPFGDVPHVARVCSGRKPSLPQFLQQNRFCFSLTGSGVTSGLQK